MGEAAGNATRAAIIAGYSKKTATQIASRLLRKVHVQQAIDERQKSDPRIKTREELQRFWSAAMDLSDEAMRDKLKASELLGKSQAVFIDRVEANVTFDHLAYLAAKTPEAAK